MKNRTLLTQIDPLSVDSLLDLSSQTFLYDYGKDVSFGVFVCDDLDVHWVEFMHYVLLTDILILTHRCFIMTAPS
jgi:hypothetical protein